MLPNKRSTSVFESDRINRLIANGFPPEASL